MRRAALAAAAMWIAFTAAGCRRGHRPGKLDVAAAAAVFDRVTLDTGGVHGLSGLAVDGDGALWTPAERGACAFRVELDGTAVRRLDKIAVTGVPAGEDLEAMAWAGGDQFWIGTEGREQGVARAYHARRTADGLQVDDRVAFTSAEAGVEIGANHGAEGACAAGERLVVALETAGQDDRGRWAPVIVVDGKHAHTSYKVRLTTATGKLSGLDCWADPAAGDAITVLAIERHFEVTRLVRFTLPPGGGEVATTVVLDLAPVLRGSLNLEGIARLPDGRVVAVIDNQYNGVHGPDELLVFKPDRLALPAAAP